MSEIYGLAIRNLLRLGASLAITMCLGFILKAILPRVFGIETIGKFYYLESLGTITFTFLSLGVHAYINRYIPNDPSEANRCFRPMLLLKLAFGGLLIVGLYWYSHLMNFESYTRNILLIFSIHFLLQAITVEYFKPFLLAIGEVKLVSKIEVSSKIIQVSGVLITLAFGPDLTLVVIAYSVTSLAPFSLILWKAKRLGWLEQRFDWPICRSMIWIGLPFFVNGALLSLYGNFDVLILNQVANQTELGLYGTAQRLKGVLLLVVPLLSSAILPLLSKSLHESQNVHAQFLTHVFRALLVLSFPAAALMAIFAPEAVFIVYGSQFAESARILILLAPVVIFTFGNVFLSLNLTLISSGKALTLVTLTGVLVNVSLNWLLIPYGMSLRPIGGGGAAAALTTIAAEALTCFLLLTLTPTRLMKGRVILEAFLIAIPLIGLTIIADTLLGLGLGLRLLIAVAVVVYMIGTGMVRRSDIFELRKALAHRA